MIFSVIAFTIPISKSIVFWISYLFGLLAMAFQIPLWNRALDKETLGSKYLSFPVLQIGATYLIIQIIISIIMMVIPTAPTWAAVIINSLIFAIACFLVISGDVAKTRIENTENKVQISTGFIKGLKSDVYILLAKETDPNVKNELSKLTDEIRYSDPMSSRDLVEIEKQIAEKVASIETAGEDKLILITEIRELLEQRNIRCKSLK